MKRLFFLSLLLPLLLSACQPRLALPGSLEDYADVRNQNLSATAVQLDEAKIKTFWYSSASTRWPANAAPIAERLL